DRLGRYAPPPVSRRDLTGDWDTLEAWAGAAALEADAAAQAARDEVGQARRAVVELTSRFEERADGLGVPGAAGPVRDRVVGAREAAAGELARFDADLARAERARAEHEAAAAEEAVARELALHLRADRFQRWLLGEAFERLVAAATVILHELSGGAYSLGLDARRDFAVVDHHNADTVRGVRTLSGGETFLASLALALALADQVVDLAAGGSARLESLFLDEGFGTLDPETLDVVAAAIEELGSRGRMVGVVSHVRDLAERLPVRYEVAKGPTTATVTRVAA
ncbi:MAG: SMC family ATPase, partial [Acidimicrobiia bacterium]|nr:SMC family ATPase [Acidimicrobiia bacterium]